MEPIGFKEGDCVNAFKKHLKNSLIMITVSVLTSALTTKRKQHKVTKAEIEKERMRANLLQAVSHDLRTPLTTIYGFSTTLLENSSIITEAQKAKIVTGIKEDSQWLIRMVENLFSITRITALTYFLFIFYYLLHLYGKCGIMV